MRYIGNDFRVFRYAECFEVDRLAVYCPAVKDNVSRRLRRRYRQKTVFVDDLNVINAPVKLKGRNDLFPVFQCGNVLFCSVKSLI